MKQLCSALGVIAPLAFVMLGLNPVHAQANDMFPTRAAAEKRAKELQCSGSFAMGSEWMPCANERALHDALQKAQ